MDKDNKKVSPFDGLYVSDAKTTTGKLALTVSPSLITSLFDVFQA